MENFPMFSLPRSGNFFKLLFRKITLQTLGSTMHIWVDADSCPKAIKNILFKAATRTRLPLTLVANHPLHVPSSPFIKSILVPGGADVADAFIAERVLSGELVITDDLPLAAKVISKGAVVLTTRGKWLTPKNIGERLSFRNFKEELRGSGIDIGGPPSPSLRDRQNFANHLDHFLSGR